MRATTSALVDEFKSDVGSKLRVVAKYDAEQMRTLYVRDDVEEERPRAHFDNLHGEMMREHLERPHIEADLNSGKLRSSMLGFEQMLVFNFISSKRGGSFSDVQGYVVTTEPDVVVDLSKFIHKFEVAAPVQKRLGKIEFNVPERGDRVCPNCGSNRTIATPQAGPESPYYCMECDRSFT